MCVLWIWLPAHRRSPTGEEAHRPQLLRGGETDEPIPERFRGLRLRRTRLPKVEPTPLIIHLAIAAAILGFMFAALKMLAGGG